MLKLEKRINGWQLTGVSVGDLYDEVFIGMSPAEALSNARVAAQSAYEKLLADLKADQEVGIGELDEAIAECSVENGRTE
jgi:hypothetical protein